MHQSRFQRTSNPAYSRRTAIGAGLSLAGSGVVAARGRGLAAASGATPQASPVATDPAAHIVSLARDAMAELDLRAVILRVVIDGDELVTTALGESMTGVPATPEMRFRNGAVAIAYIATALLRLVDQGAVGLDDPLATWMPNLPDADQVTLRMLADMTAGYPDYVRDDAFVAAFYADPFRQWSAEELIDIGASKPRMFAPGTNWDYSHTNYVILGRALEAIAGRPLANLLQESVIEPMGLSGTVSAATAEIPEPALHAFSAERREALGIEPAGRFYEESTYWNPSWTLADGSIQTTTIQDMTTTAIAVGTGSLLTPESHAAQVEPRLLGFGSPLEGCPACHTLDERYSYGLGVVLSGGWILQSPLFGGYSAVEAYLPSRKIAIAAATTYSERAFDAQGNYRHGNASEILFARIGAYLAPEDSPPA